jgi:iron-sulfur cluster insertion protein
MITVQDTAQERIRDILADEGNPDLKLRIFVQGGGCSGFSYGFTLDEIANEDDHVIDFETFKILIDSMSAMYLEGSSIGFKDELWAKEFVITNPNAQSTCGCGSSFSI